MTTGESSAESASTTGAAYVPVVGIGASAGGLEAFTQLLAHLPRDSGMAYVLVQHLAPAHESILAELLSRQSSIPVLQVSDGTLVEANHVYVIPPNTTMRLEDGHLRLAPRDHGPHPIKPVDEFFRSLAEAAGSNGVGVVLSGADADGAKGLEAIKQAGGLTFAQEPASAAFDSMPRAAITTGCVDFILTPQDIAVQLARLGAHAELREPNAYAAEPSGGAADPLTSILGLLRTRFGVDFTQYRLGTITRRLLRRMMLRRIDRVEDYLALVRNEVAELDALQADLLIGVSSFFRDPDAFAALTTVAFPTILAHRPGHQALRFASGFRGAPRARRSIRLPCA